MSPPPTAALLNRERNWLPHDIRRARRLYERVTLRFYGRCKFSACNWQVLSSHLIASPSASSRRRTRCNFSKFHSLSVTTFPIQTLGWNLLFTTPRRMSCIKKRFCKSISRKKQSRAHVDQLFEEENRKVHFFKLKVKNSWYTREINFYIVIFINSSISVILTIMMTEKECKQRAKL